MEVPQNATIARPGRETSSDAKNAIAILPARRLESVRKAA
jgi:hypothetical protein